MPKPPKASSSKKSVHQDIVLVHGFRGSPIGLSAIAAELRAVGYRVCTPPIPPFAGADKIPAYTPEAYAKYLLNYCKSNHLDRPILIGHSMGSTIVASALRFYPDSFSNKAVLLSPISTRPALFFRLITPLCAIAPCRIVDYVTTRYLFASPDHKSFRSVLKITNKCSGDHPPKKNEVFHSAKFSANYCLNDFHLSPNTLLIAGEHDHLIRTKDTIALANKYNYQLTFLPNCGHLHNYESPHTTAEEILKFLNSNWRKTS